MDAFGCNALFPYYHIILPQLHYYRKLLFACPMIEIRWDQGKNQLEIMVHVLDLIENYLNTGGERGNLNVCVLG